tara:strand:+ start:6556 stop:7926 length:1371 start_codon:yes stop_codon:yes gene_type:complete
MKLINFIILICALFSVDNKYSSISYQNNVSNYQNDDILDSYSTYDFELLSERVDPDKYIVGPGDVFLFNMVTSSRVVNIQLITSPTGHILIPIIGKVDVKNKTINEVYNLITDKCKEKYEDAYIHINIIKLRKFKVLVTGDFKASGMYQVSSINKVTDLIEDINLNIDISSYNDSLLNLSLIDFPQNILLDKSVILSRNGIDYNLDLFNYYLNSEIEYNPYLIEGDIIKIVNSDDIAILGDVETPIRVNFKKDLTFSDLFKENNITIDFKSLKVFNHIMLSNGNNSEIERITNISSEFRSDFDESYLSSRIKSKNGFTHITNEKDLLNLLNIKVSKGDIIVIPNKLDYIQVIGATNKPGLYKYIENLKVNDYLEQSGGFSDFVKNHDIYIVNETNGSKKIVDYNYIPNRGDIIFIEEELGFKSWQRFTEKVKLAGTISTILASIINIMWIIDRANN